MKNEPALPVPEQNICLGGSVPMHRQLLQPDTVLPARVEHYSMDADRRMLERRMLSTVQKPAQSHMHGTLELRVHFTPSQQNCL